MTELINNDEMKVTYTDTKEVRDKVFKKLLDYYKRHEAFSGEEIMQADDPQIEAPDLLSNIADELLKFEVEWK